MAVVGEEEQAGEKLETFAFPGGADQSAAQKSHSYQRILQQQKDFLAREVVSLISSCLWCEFFLIANILVFPVLSTVAAAVVSGASVLLWHHYLFA